MDRIDDLLSHYWPHLVFAFSIVAGAGAAIHAAMTKQDVRAAIGWVGVALFSPIFGALLYFVAGINRIRRTMVSQQRDEAVLTNVDTLGTATLGDVVPYSAPQFASMRTLGDKLNYFQLLGGNRVRPLNGGDETYPAMLAAIRGAQHCIAMQSYIFDNDPIGREIAEALIEAHARGVQVRVLIDAVGSRYSHPPIVRTLTKGGVPTARFMTNPLGVLRMPYANLRSHRKVLVVDGRHGLSGGMNVRAAFVSALSGAATNLDTHFEFHGPIVGQLMSVFAHDWSFTTHETLAGDPWFPAEANEPVGSVPVRCVASGPDRAMGTNHNMLLGALAVAQHHVRIQSPYFLPDQTLIGALATAARRGIIVDVVIPEHNNLRLVDYAMQAQIDQIVLTGCRVWRAGGSFDHSKLMTVDGVWSYVGSSNLDPRSLRLNFELDTEIYDAELAAWVAKRIDGRIAQAHALTLDQLRDQPFLYRLRNKLIWLASPYL
ncbi:phospholipase D-like domain-containing protein [Bordetella avium]|uniref:phospholipase D-like domain-containing protein n=1 Tax=Bordetella avium TaxID=521 RepID=UPI000E0BE87B|nr:phospholipase D-like domain-containing protein [Bordetella avium]RIQ13090.1 cardiolipin synthase [Bordetella avium]RIQ37655.1 cardiolipin synthase [Bordetella avium]RIQ42219.1 cardiolipin synthase [Bordetella avium]RIQ42666.1 cardiolipin synthase [Bordetella avium]RIQ49129.1 cardiolipin synthase [Bordetella avium]